MKSMKGILGASLAGFAALTMAAITSTTTTEAIAFQAAGAKVGTAAPTGMRPASSNPGVSMYSTRMQDATNREYPHMRINTGPPPTPPLMRPETRVVGQVKFPRVRFLPETKLGAKRLKGPKYFDSKMQHILDDFNRMRDLSGPGRPLPPGVDPGKIPGYDGPDKSPEGFIPDPNNPWRSYTDTNRLNDISWRSCRWDEATENKVQHWGSGRDNPLYTEGTELWRVDNCTGTNKGKSSGITKPGGSNGTSAGAKPQNDSGGETKPQDDSGGKKKPVEDTGGGKPSAEKDPNPEGDDPDEIRNAVRVENLNIAGMRDQAAMGGHTGSGREGGPGTTPQRPDGSGWERHRAKISGRGAADPDDIVGPAEMANPMGVSAVRINLSRGQAMSPTVDGRQSGNGPSGPIGPVATQVQSRALSVNMSGHLNAAMANPMGSPPVDEFGKGGNGGGHVDPR
jgi:hypothetical protein